MTEVFTLSWDDFDKKCPKAFKDLWLDTDLSDVTLATEDGGQLSAHKVILAACSPLFKRLLQKNLHFHPLLWSLYNSMNHPKKSQKTLSKCSRRS